MKAAAGKDGITAQMMNRGVSRALEGTVQFVEGSGMVPSMWTRSMVVPMPKTRSKGACWTEEFLGICLVSVVYKAICLIVQERLVKVVEERQSLAEDQGGFRRGRGCRDQILTLTLLGQTMMSKKKKGMLAAFIVFRKA